MKRIRAFAGRNFREILRDPLDLGFGLGFPIVLLLLLTVIQRNIPVSIFELPHLTPGIAVFSLSFLSLFAGLLLAHDRESAFLVRLYTSPMKPREYLAAYALPLLPVALLQGAVCFVLAFFLGLPFSWGTLLSLASLLPAALFYTALGLLFGSLCTEKQVGSLSGALLTNLSAWLSGVWFDITLLGEGFGAVCRVLPFYRAVELARAAFVCDPIAWEHLGVLCAWCAVTATAAVIVFRRRLHA